MNGSSQAINALQLRCHKFDNGVPDSLKEMENKSEVHYTLLSSLDCTKLSNKRGAAIAMNKTKYEQLKNGESKIESRK